MKQVTQMDSASLNLEKYVHDFQVDYNSIDKSGILNIHKYLIIQIIIK